MRADYVKNSDDTVLSAQPQLYRKDEPNNTSILVNNNAGDVALIFQKDAVTQMIQPEDNPTKIDLHITSPDRLRRTFFKFGFSSRSQTSSFYDSLN